MKYPVIYSVRTSERTAHISLCNCAVGSNTQLASRAIPERNFPEVVPQEIIREECIHHGGIPLIIPQVNSQAEAGQIRMFGQRLETTSTLCL